MAAVTFMVALSMLAVHVQFSDRLALAGRPFPSAPPVAITSNTGLETYPGNGTAGNPYRIENLTISTTSPQVAISIQHTRAHVLVRNCTISTSNTNINFYGIKFFNASNVRIENNTLINNFQAIFVDNCSNVRVAGNGGSAASNIASNKNWRFITAWASTNVTIDGNVIKYFYQYGARVGGDSANVSITGNAFTYSMSASGQDYAGVKLATVTGCTVSGNNLTGGYHGIHADGTGNSRIHGNFIHGIQFTGIILQNSDACLIWNNSLQDSIMMAINNNVDSTLVANNTFNGNMGIDVAGTGIANLTITGNVITGTYTSGSSGELCGIYNRFSSDVNVSGNVISRISGYGIRMSNGASNVITSNHVHDNGKHGVFLLNQTSTIVSGNNISRHLHSTNGYGVRVDSSITNVIAGNTMDSNYKAAVWLVYGSTGNLVANNTCTNGWGTALGRDAAIKVQGATGNEIRNNTVFANDIYGISLWNSAHSNVVVENRVIDTRYQGIYIEESNDTIIAGNEIRDTFLDYDDDVSGIYAYQAGNLTITGNTIRNNTVHGIWLEDCQDVLVHGNDVAFHEEGILIEGSTNVTTWYNAFRNNTNHARDPASTGIAWDNGSAGNYWDDYTTRYPGATNAGGTWDTPYQVDAGSDRYPLAWDPTMPNEQAPSLSGAARDPPAGTQQAAFTFSVTYTDADNNAPASIRVVINDTGYPLARVNSGDVDYTAGVAHAAVVYLQPGTWTYHFHASDGKFETATANETVTVSAVANGNDPVLSAGGVTPATGYLGTSFTFTVTYTDADNNAPASITVTIDGTPHAMQKANPSDSNYMDGCVYRFVTTLATTGTHVFSFQASDGTRAATPAGPFNGPEVLAAPTFNGAVDNDALVFTHGGHATWIPQLLVTHDGIDAVESGSIDDDESSWFETTVSGTGTISFWWRVSSEEDYDYLIFSVNSVEQASIAGEVGWERVEITFTTPGTRVLRWAYEKDVSVSEGEDRGWVDEITWTGSSSTPGVPGAPQNLSCLPGDGRIGLSWTAPASNGGAAITTYSIYRSTEGGPFTWIANVTGTTYTDANLVNGQLYTYHVKAHNSAGASTASNEASARPSETPVDIIQLIAAGAWFPAIAFMGVVGPLVAWILVTEKRRRG